MEAFDFINLWRLTSYLPMGENSIASGVFRWKFEMLLGLTGISWVSFFILGKLRKDRLAPQDASLLKPLFVAIVFCLGFTLATQWIGRRSHDFLQPEEQAPDTSQNGKNPSQHRPHRANRGNIFMLLAAAGVIIVGGGYAFTVMQDLGPVTHFFAFSFGVGLTAELGKLLAAAILDSPGPGLHRNRPTLLPFLVAGLGFGLAESLLYLGDYSMAAVNGIGYYLRGSWSVLLHTSWAAITGYMVLSARSKVPEIGEVLDFTESFWAILFLMLPAALLHGLYDALCAHDEPIYALLVGLMSLGFGWLACGQFKAKPRKAKTDIETE